jgi:hypothetical protein
MPRSLAFKCTYNDGDSGEYVGLRGTCSRDLIVHNVQNHVWCSQPENDCRKFYEAGMQGKKPEFPCMESELFEFWQFNGGAWHHGPRKGKPIPVQDAGIGEIVILTTRKPETEERERRIIGAYEIGKIDEGNLVAHPDFRIRLRNTEAEQLSFWRYYRNGESSNPFWGTMLFRYLEDGQVHRILTDVATVVGESASKEVVDQLIERKFGGQEPPPAAGALTRGASVEKKVALSRKYPGGEGPEHRALKHWIADNPSSIGLPADSKKSVEHLFESGDCVDIAFSLPNGDCAAVEIETTQPFPGAHQAIKYRALLAAQRNWNLDSRRVTGILVAWAFSSADLTFCKKYGLQAWTCRKGEAGTMAV